MNKINELNRSIQQGNTTRFNPYYWKKELISLKKLLSLEIEPFKSDSKDFEQRLHDISLTLKSLESQGQLKKTSFNIFEVLGCQKDENIHSNIISWLLNPEESHGLGHEFTNIIIEKFYKTTLPHEIKFNVRREVARDEGRPDIIGEYKGWQLVLENKIDSPEIGDKNHPYQTQRYSKPYRLWGGIGERFFLFYLTPLGTPPKAGKYFRAISYSDIAIIIDGLSFPEKIQPFIRDFVDHLYRDICNY
jgi:PD-(D/E)XK nuclease superfamily